MSAGFIEKRPLERYIAPAKPWLVGYSRGRLAEALGGIGVPERQQRMRVQQIWHWLYVRGAQDFDNMTTLSKDSGPRWGSISPWRGPKSPPSRISADGTRKWLLRLPGETGDRPHEVECVYIPKMDSARCVARSAATLDCTFCHTGTQRLVRNLTAEEIAGQVVLARDRLNDWTRSDDENFPKGQTGETAEPRCGQG